MTEQKWIHEGLITESLSNGMFRVRLDNEDLVLGYVSGKMRRNFIQILPGDKVKIEISGYDSTRGRIISRLDNDNENEKKDSKENEKKDSKENEKKDSKD
uniref:Translation initiation factor IF-1, chloroplastic n=2 Tax=Adenocalymma TaxID=353917 RepID=A0A2P1G916_9LAMI|nr:translational initiation factor 1 [Adenocalymma divaricatum]AVM81448.1 translational initiation factor 1 [Adenocalymma divaricatum]AVM83815.1 translational initiation factor 1 [Adenocalymma gracielzae]